MKIFYLFCFAIFLILFVACSAVGLFCLCLMLLSMFFVEKLLFFTTILLKKIKNA